MGRQSAAVLATLLGGACNFNTGGVGDSGPGAGDVADGGDSSTAGVATTGPTSSEPTTTPATSNGASTLTTAATGTETGGDALLEISHGPQFDYGDVDIQLGATHVFTVSNVGEDPATPLLGQLSGDGYRFSGGAFPGGGDCTDTLDPGEACLVGVEFRPAVFVDYPGQLAVSHAGGTATRVVNGFGIGTTDNLLVNGDAEMLGDPPLGWTESAGTNWIAGNMDWPPHTGNGHFWPRQHNDVDPVELRQDVDIAGWAPLVDAGLVTLDFTAWGRSFEGVDDDYRIVLEVGEGGGFAGEFDSGWQNSDGWREYSDAFQIATGTAALRLRLLGRLNEGGSNTNAYFDDLVLTATYRP